MLFRSLRYLDTDNYWGHWLLRLEVLLAWLEPTERGKIGANLQLPKESIERLKHLAVMEAEIKEKLPECQLISEIVSLLRHYHPPSLVLLAVRSSKAVRRTLWQYLTQWSQIHAPLNGNDLKAMGLKPGPLYKEILDVLLTATLDGKISNRAQAEELVKKLVH